MEHDSFKPKFPDFLIIGAQKGGTTTLDAYLSQHPGIFMPEKKELNYYATNNQPINWKGPGDDYPSKESIYISDSYKELFETNKLCGESSVIYLYSDSAPNNIKLSNPKTKFIVVLRNPIQRAYSAYNHLRRDNREQILNFADALELEEQRISEEYESLWHYKKVGLYGQQLQRYFALFDPSQFLIFLNEDLRADASSIASKCYSFLGIDSAFSPDTDFNMNASGIPKNQKLNDFFCKENKLKDIAKKIIPLKTGRKIKYFFQKQNLDSPSDMTAEVKKHLIDFYKEDILLTEKLISRSLAHWLD